MLRRHSGFVPLGVLIGAFLAAVPAHAKAPAEPAPAAEPPRAIREPVRLTAGATNELMGTLSPDEKALYFVSDASGTLDIMRQSPVQSGPVTLSNSLGDAAWPRLSPDGTKLAYLSFQTDSTGNACVRPIEGGKLGEEKCLTGPASAELMVLWWDDRSLAVLSRAELHGDFRLLHVPIDGSAPSTLVARDMVGLALSPDRRWLAYIPLSKASDDVGVTFAQRTGVGIALQHLRGNIASGAGSSASVASSGSAPSSSSAPSDSPHASAEEGAPGLYAPSLPGVTGSVAFSEKGDYLEFTQFLNDTNRDGVIDGDDNAVIFRVPFHADLAQPISAADEPEQLTSARWDCHYPAPAKTRLIASCSHEGSLDVYSLPLEGAVPHEWDDARLAGEIAVARDLWTALLLSARRLSLAPNPAAKESIVRQMMGLHLALGEYESTIYYAENRLTSPEGRTFGQVVSQLAQHRRADLALIRGEPSAAYIQSERARADNLGTRLTGAEPGIAQLITLVISEIEEDVGDKAAALATFQKLDVKALADPLLAPLVAGRAERLYRLRAERQSLLGVYRELSSLQILDVAARLVYAQRFVDELMRGEKRVDRAGAIAAARDQVQDTSDLALLLDVEKALLPLDTATQEQVRAQIFSLYTKNKDPARRRALVLDTLRTAAKAGNEYVQYQFVTTWASSLAPSQPERKNAEALYNGIVLDRAYGEGRAGKLGESRGYFYGATVATDSLEAHIGFIEARLEEGKAGGPKGEAAADKELDEIYQKRFARDPSNAVYAFVRAYRIARLLPGETDLERHERDVTQAIELLEHAAERFPKDPQVHQLWGFVLHQRARRSGSREAAVSANRHYLLALDLAHDDERLTATLLHRLGLLQASLGSHGPALRYLEQREQLPSVRPLEELGLHVAIAESAWHMGDGNRAKDEMLRALALMQKTPGFERYAALVLDRLGMALALAGDSKAAQSRYAELATSLSHSPEGTPRNRVKAQVGLASTALANGDSKGALEALGSADQLLAKGGDLDPPEQVVFEKSLIDDYHYTSVQYRALVAGLRASAQRKLGDVAAALAATELRVQLLEERLKKSEADEDRLELAQAYHQQAALQYRSKDSSSAARSVERGLALSDTFNQNTGSEVNDAGLALLRDYAELHLYGGVPLDGLRRDLRGELQRAYGVICKYRSPNWAEQRFLFETYLTALSLNGT